MSRAQGNILIVTVIIVVLLVAASYTWSVTKKKQEIELYSSPAGQALVGDETVRPYTDIRGETVSMSNYVGDVLVVSSWASWCPSCGTELLKLSQLAESYQDKNVRFLAINRAEPATTAERYLRSIGDTEGVTLVLDPDDRYYRSIGGYAMPELVFYDMHGDIVYHHRGELSVDEMRRYLDAALDVPTE